MLLAGLIAGTAWATLAAAQKKPNWSPTNLTHTTEPGQTGYNDCGTGSSQSSMCQTMYINSINDFCIWAPPNGPQAIGASEEIEVAWCTTPGRGTRVIPPGALRSVHFIQTPNFIQITGNVDGTMLNIQAGDEGGELDPHGMTGSGNPIGSVVFSNAFGGGTRQVKEWMNFMSDGEFCFRACNPSDPNAWLWCQHIYDTMGCHWVMPGNYDSGFDTCLADSPVGPPGVYGSSTFNQGDPATPAAHDPGASSQCTPEPTIEPSLMTAAPVSASSSSSMNSTTSSASMTTSTTVSVPTTSATHSSTSASAAASTKSSSATTVSSIHSLTALLVIPFSICVMALTSL